MESILLFSFNIKLNYERGRCTTENDSCSVEERLNWNLGGSYFDAATCLLNFFREIISTQFFWLNSLCLSMILVSIVISL